MDEEKRKFTAADYNLTQAAYTIDDFAQIIDTGRNRLYKDVQSGLLVLTKIGKCSRITTPDAVLYLNRLRAASFPRKNQVA